MNEILMNKYEFSRLVGQVNDWGIARGLTVGNGATIEAQAAKLVEEATELREAARVGDLDGIIDGIGDSLVVLIQASRLSGISFDQALKAAWKEIENRKGEMRFGIFVKEGDLKGLELQGTPLRAMKSLEELTEALGKFKGTEK